MRHEEKNRVQRYDSDGNLIQDEHQELSKYEAPMSLQMFNMAMTGIITSVTSVTVIVVSLLVTVAVLQPVIRFLFMPTPVPQQYPTIQPYPGRTP